MMVRGLVMRAAVAAVLLAAVACTEASTANVVADGTEQPPRAELAGGVVAANHAGERPARSEVVARQPTEAVEQASRAEPTASFPVDATYRDDGFLLRISEVAFLGADELIAVMAERGRTITEPLLSRAYVALEITAVNGTGEVAEWYPVEGMLIIGTEHLESSLSPDGPVGGTFQPEEVKGDFVLYGSKSSVDDLAGYGRARLLADPPLVPVDLVPLASDVDVAVEWMPKP